MSSGFASRYNVKFKEASIYNRLSIAKNVKVAFYMYIQLSIARKKPLK